MMKVQGSIPSPKPLFSGGGGGGGGGEFGIGAGKKKLVLQK